ncbi:MAG: Crp/Fnr family transcriptional regulator [Hydrogenophaga sp.]
MSAPHPTTPTGGAPLPAVSTFNRMLVALKRGDATSWSRQLAHVELQAGQELMAPGGTPHHLHFPTSALVVLMQPAPGGLEAPVALVGHDGAVGLAGLLGGGPEQHRALVVQSGWAWRMPTTALQDDAERAAQMLPVALDHLQSLTVQMAQAAFCRRQHSVEQNLGRWLLTALDRLPGSALALGLPALAPLIGAAPGALEKAAAALVRSGALVCEPDRLLVPNRRLLEAQSCGCHAPGPPAG